MNVKSNFGEIWIPADMTSGTDEPVSLNLNEKVQETVEDSLAPEVVEPATDNDACADTDKNIATTETNTKVSQTTEPTQPVKPKKEITVPQNKSYEEMTIEELQAAILERMRRNGPVTDQMKKDVMENVYHNSLVTWIKSFN